MNINETIGTLKKKKIVFSNKIHNFRKQLTNYHLHTVCQEARCPNISECFDEETATFLVMGNVCTRNCGFCSIKTGVPLALDWSEIDKLIETIKQTQLSYVVITSVTRDDLPDGGAKFLSDLAWAIAKQVDIPCEILFPDFKGLKSSLDILLNAPISVYNHNIEMVESLFSFVRPQGNYERSLKILKYLNSKKVFTKTGFMVGLGEKEKDILKLLDDVKATGVKMLTIGQYIQPTKQNVPVQKYYSQDEFDYYKKYALSIGISQVVASPFVRSSYKAKDLYDKLGR